MGRVRRYKSRSYSDASGTSASSQHSTATTQTANLGSEAGDATGLKGLTGGDRKIVQRYVREYRDGCRAVLDGKEPVILPSMSTSLNVADCRLPALTLDVLEKPYLCLPKEFSSKQRRAIHEICSDLGLYHLGTTFENGDRCILLSIYCDGIEEFPGIQSQLQSQTVSQMHTRERLSGLKPWARWKTVPEGELHPEEATERGRSAIYELVDQPGEAIRDNIDFLDFKEMENADLSKVAAPSFDPVEWMLVDSPELMRKCAEEIKAAAPTEIAFDLEGYNPSKYMQMTCLIQLATNKGKEYVIDPLAPGVWDLVSLLRPFFADPKIVKIGHSIGGMDVRCLHRDFGIFVVNAFDTFEAATCLQLSGKGLAKVCAYYGLPDSEVYAELKAEYQTCDWTRRPLTEPMIRYGRYDVHYLIQIRQLMIRDLCKPELWEAEIRQMEARKVRDSIAAMMSQFDEDEEVFVNREADNDDPILDSEGLNGDGNNGSWTAIKQSYFEASELRMNLDLMQAVSRSQDRCLDLWVDQKEPALKDSEFQAVIMRSQVEGLVWTKSQVFLYEKLADWRDEVSAHEECTGGWVCSLGFLASVALRRPTSLVGLKQISYVLPSILDNSDKPYLDELFELVKSSRTEDGLQIEEDDMDYPSYGLLRRRQWTLKVHKFAVVGGAVACVAAIAFGSIIWGRQNLRR